MGIVSPIGNGLAATVDSLRGGRPGIGPVTSFDVSQSRSKTAGLVKDLREPKNRREARWHRASLMMAAALEELREADGAFVPEACVIGTTSGGMTFGEDFFRGRKTGNGSDRDAQWIANYPPQKAVLDTLDLAKWNVPVEIIANACASGTNAVGRAMSMIRHGLCRRVLCGGYDVISELVFMGFDCLQASTDELCRPFDKDRTGLVLGEGAALLALENRDDAMARGADIVCEISGYGISTDNHHLTQPHPSGIGPRMAMERALAVAGREAAAVDYVNAHGTATVFNDGSEGAAITELCPGVAVSSTKALTGHTLGAAGAIEAVFCGLAIREGFLPPNGNFREADPAWQMDIVANVSREKALRCVLSNSFGFGGTNASIVMEAVA